MAFKGRLKGHSSISQSSHQKTYAISPSEFGEKEHMKQLAMSFLNNYKKEFGGEFLLGKRKSKRPLSTKRPVHLVLRSDLSGAFNPGNRALEKLIQKNAKRFQIRIYDKAFNWSHIHLVIRLKNRTDYVMFIRALSSELANHVRKSKPQLKAIFTLRPFTRVLEWGKDFQQTLNYQILNQLEAAGLILRGNSHRQKTSNPR